MRGRMLGSIATALLAAGWAHAEPAAGPAPCAPAPAITPVPPTRGTFIEGPEAPLDDYLCHWNPDVCGPIADFWFGAELLSWKIEKAKLPPLVTTSPAASGGVLGAVGTWVVLDSDRLSEDSFRGGRFTAGMWLDYEQHCGLVGHYFFLAEKSREFLAGDPGGGATVLARPYVDALTGSQAARLIPFGGFQNGQIFVWAAASLQGGEINAIVNHSCGSDCAWRIDWLFGARYLQLTDDLLIREAAFDPATGDTHLVEDAFAARTHFAGPQVGLSGECRRGRWVWKGQATLALGVSHDDVHISGLTRTIAADGTTTDQSGGLLALSTNIGKHGDDQFAFVPEFRLQAGYRVCEYATLTAGYTFLAWSSVVRAGDQVDLTINPDLVPIGAGAGSSATFRPFYEVRDTSFWAHGLTVGLEVQY